MSENSQDFDEHVEKEVQRRVARQVKAANEEIEELKAKISEREDQIAVQNAELFKIGSAPRFFGVLIQENKVVERKSFQADDEVYVVDRSSPHYRKGGKIIRRADDTVVGDSGDVMVRLYDGHVANFLVGGEDVLPQIRLTSKEDGTFAVAAADGKLWQIHSAPELNLQTGETILVNSTTKQIVGKFGQLATGGIAQVISVAGVNIEIDIKGEIRSVLNTGLALERGDRVVLDSSNSVAVKKLERSSTSRYQLTSEKLITWDDIGGLEDAKRLCREAVELPFEQPEICAYYGKEDARGLLFFGPPGNGKTLLAQAVASSVALRHGRQTMNEGYIYVKSPEILNKYIGNTEAEIRELFERARRFYRKYGFKAVLAFDEFDAIAPQRGSRRSSDISDTIVPMFLGEMDGIDSDQTKANPIVIVMTNRVDVLDPAIVRPGRFSTRIKIDRPDSNTALNILKIHARGVPFEKEGHRDATLAIITQDLFSKTRLLYRINNEHDFTLGDCVSGAMLQSVVEIAKSNAMQRDIVSKTKTGITTADGQAAVNMMYKQQFGMNHSYDLHDFAEKLGIQPQDMKYDRCYGAA
jgi:proteasome-associated ATPase